MHEPARANILHVAKELHGNRIVKTQPRTTGTAQSLTESQQYRSAGNVGDLVARWPERCLPFSIRTLNLA